MGLIIKISWRNIMRHKGKSLVIGSILFLGALLMTVGNGITSGLDRGLQKNIVEGFSGDVVVVSDKQETDNIFLEMMGKSIEPIHNYKAIDSALSQIPEVARNLPMGKNFGMPLSDDGIMIDGVFVLGTDFAKYRAFFGDNLKVIEGQWPGEHERGVLVPTGWRKQIIDYCNLAYAVEGVPVDTNTLSKEGKELLPNATVRTSLVYMGLSADNTTTDVRTPVRAVVKYRSLNTIWGQFPILDIESYRECMGYFSAQSQTMAVKEENRQLLSMDDISMDDLFSQSDLVVANSPARGTILSAGSLTAGEEAAVRETDLENGAYNMILVRLKDSRHLESATAKINRIFKEKKVAARAVTWKKASGMIGSMAMLIKSSLFVFVMLLFFVAIIIIINTLSMAALERTNEIGMMRAVGARKGFISSMFFGETALLSFFFGGLGIAAGLIVVWILRLLHLTTDNDMLQLLYGGDTFSPFLSVADIALAVFQLAIVTLIAVIYPLRVARRITPLDAISRE